MALAVPNFSEGRDADAISAIATAFARARLLDRHTDEVHNRTVLTLAGSRRELFEGLVDGARACVERIDIDAHTGAHPCIGALDVCPLVWLAAEERPAARELALALAPALTDLGLPVFLYGELATAPERRERAFFRAGGITALKARMAAGELEPDLGPAQPHPTAGAVLVTARPPLAAFNVELDSDDLETAREIAASLRESGGGIEGVRAIAIDLGERAQISTNVHDPLTVSLAEVIERIRVLGAERGVRPVAGEVVGLVPEASLRELPGDVPLRGFDPDLQVLERRLG
ncbi:MAG: glutamate formiminotransferase / 5-formyltetrahydrofolate cyclo-ligase [Solirubrobacterales bacterium]|jgi:glutamate formiminotransferase|nr:glutamate formiminotransferase / 5-formyltetrahydrofolate cyclo-ligase [Solirubrobacterales bacterium]